MTTFVSITAVIAALVAAAPQEITFTETIAPIVYQHCVSCHRPGEAGPFSLLTYDDVRARGAMIAKVTASRYMPPWQAVHGYGEFAEERRLSDEQIAQIGKWVDADMPQGDPARLPPAPAFTDGWQLGVPDLILEMPQAYTVPANGRDVYRNFVLPLKLSEDKWVRAVEYRPSARKAVHHVLFGYIGEGTAARLDGADGEPGFFGGMAPVGMMNQFGRSGGVGGWAVGGTPRFWPGNQSLLLPKGSDFVLQTHFHPTGKTETERSVVGIYFADTPPERAVYGADLPALWGFGAGIDIPAGESRYTVRDSLTLPTDVRVYGVTAHAHYIATEMKATATLPDGSERPLIWIDDWDFNWQDTYSFKEPFVLPAGSRIDVVLIYDNSAGNPRNPNSPPQRVEWGEQSTDEMANVTVLLEAVKKEDEPLLNALFNQRTQAAIKQGIQNGGLSRLQALPRTAPR